MLFHCPGFAAVASCSTPIDLGLFKGKPEAPQWYAVFATATICVISPFEFFITKCALEAPIWTPLVQPLVLLGQLAQGVDVGQGQV